ncbi:MAG: PAS domain S-box protein [Actinomycetota bacterium]|nr:PAS domain S-box protein [Actinomycetota bacterium]
MDRKANADKDTERELERLRRRVSELEQSEARLKNAEEELLMQTQELDERLRELDCLYEIYRIVERTGVTLEEILQGVVDILPQAFHYPYCTRMRILLEGREHVSADFAESPWLLSGDLFISDRKAGALHVYYLEEKPVRFEGPFSIEERKLIDIVAERLSRIIERFRAEKILLDEKAFTENALDALTDAFYVVGTDAKMLRWNRMLSETSGYSDEELFNMTVFDFFDEDSLQERLAFYSRLLEKGWASIEAPVVTKDGRHIPYYFRSTLLRDAEGNPYAVCGVGRDVSERKEAEEALRESEERYRDLFENASDLIQSMTPEGRFSYVNRAWRDTLGYDEDDLEELTIFDIIHPDSLDHCIEMLRKVMSGEEAGDIEVKLVAKDGREVMVQGSASCRFEGGKPVNIRGIFHDVTESRLAEEALRRSEEYYRSLIENAYDAVTVINADGTMRYFSPSLEKLAGYKPDELAEGNAFSYIHPDDLPEILKIVSEGSAIPNLTANATYRFRHKDGSWRWVEAVGRNLLGDPSVRGIVVNYRDVTELVEAERISRIQRNLALELSETVEVHDILMSSLEAVLEASGLDCGGIYILNEETGNVELACHRGVSDSFVEAARDYNMESPEIGLLQAGKPVYRGAADNIFTNEDLLRIEGLRSLASVPIIHKGKLTGCLNLASHTLDEIPGKSRNVIEIITSQIGQALARSLLLSALWESEERYRLLHDEAGVGIFSYDRDLVLRSINHKACEQLGYTEDELLGKNVMELGILYSEDVEKAAVGIEALFSGENVYVEELRLLRKDGSFIYTEMTGAALFDEQGQVIGVSNIFNDITRRKWAEEALRESEERFRAISSTAKDAIIMIDDKGNVTYWNPAAEEIFGYTSQEALGRELHMMIAPQRYRDAYVRGFKDFGDNGTGPVIGKTFEIGGLRKDGSEFPMELSLSSLLIEGRWHAVGIVRDITERKRVEESLYAANRELEAFAHTLSHDLRSPLASIYGYARLLEKMQADRLSEEGNEWLGQIIKSIKNTDGLIISLLDYARAGRPGGNIERVEPLEVLREILEEREGSERDRDTEISVDERMPPIRADAVKLGQVFSNLLDNAIKYGAVGALTRIDVGAEKESGMVTFHVTDNGMGIAADKLKVVFEPFTRLKTEGGSKGLGIGLSTVKRAVEGWGGTVWAESTPGEGTSFFFTAPAASQ